MDIRRHLPVLRRWTRLCASLGLAVVAVFIAVAASRVRLEAPEPTVLVRDRDGRFLTTVADTQRWPGEDGLGYWRVDEIPERVAAAMMAIEDRRFYQHPGVDLRAVGRAITQNVRSGRRISGASTLAMQVARMQNPGPRTYPRKAVEALTALMLTTRYGREAVLAHYLRIVPYSNRIHGIGFASRMYFDKPVADLSWAETAFLAAIPQSPSSMNPFDPLGRGRAINRASRILRQMAADGTLSSIELVTAERQLRRLHVTQRHYRPDDAVHAALRFESALRFERVLKNGGLPPGDPIVPSTLDLDLQSELTWLVREAVLRWQKRGAGNAALLVVDRETWEVRAAVSSIGYFDEDNAGSIDYLRVPRSSGSTLKPFFYALALERGVITPATILDDLDRGYGSITNSDERFLGPLLPRVALANSRNVPAANLLDRVGLDNGYAFLSEAGLNGNGTARRYGLGLAIGGLPVTLEDLVRAYTVFANGGRLRDLTWRQDRVAPQQPSKRLLNEETARQITLFLSDPSARLPTFPRMGWLELPFAVAVKTGTSSRYRDAWTVAYSSRYLIGVWVGHPDHRPMSGLSGYRTAARLAHSVMSRLHKDQQDGLEALSFPAPRGYRDQRVCSLTGRLATPACDRVVVERFAPGQEVVHTCEAHRFVAVDRRNSLLATAAVPASEIEVRSFVELEPRYAAWAASAGLPRPPRQASGLNGGVAVSARPVLQNSNKVRIVAPLQDLHVLPDPETPAALRTISLRAVVEPAANDNDEVVWYVNGKPFKAVGYPFTARWPLSAGEHVFEARLPSSGARSKKVRVTVEE